jgi:glucoamylase
MKMIIDELLFGKTELTPYVEDYITAQAILQTVSNPSGALLPSGLGLGEPKYKVDGTKFSGNWGRPQRDGPALRAIAIMTYSNHLIQQGDQERVKDVIWPVIANDLAYTGQYWNQTGFDLWEEVSGTSFFTTLNQYRSLVEGGRLASALGLSCPACEQAPNILCFLQTYWNGAYLVANTNTNIARTGIDANTMLASISVFDPAASCDSPTYQPCHPQSLASFKVFVDTFRNPTLYPINAGLPNTSGVALGRYAEDTYYNGNPWYLITLGAAEFLYDAVAQWSAAKSITIDDVSLPFFQDLYPNAKVGVYKQCKKTSPFRQILTAATKYADSFVSVAQKYTPETGALAEQFLKTAPGTPTSARDLTWSYAAFMTMAERRAGQYPPSWVDASASVPDTCVPGSVKGTYAPATAAGAPNITVGCTTTVQFAVNASTYYGENIYLVGNTSDLGAWDVNEALSLRSTNYTSERPLWFLPAALTAGQTVSYAYVRQEDCGQPWIWESVNRTLTVPACIEGDESVRLTTDDAWTGEVGKSGGC